MTNEKFSFRARVDSFGYAFKGIRNLLRYEHNAIIHLIATAVIIIAGLWLKIERWEWIVIVMAVGFVWVTEILNTCVERIMDFISTEQHPKIGVIKDLAAGAVLIAALTAVVAGAFIFIPKIIALL
ncbi:diacylglycerol kinase family protein [Pseudobacter ginsenosidimutans]|jgi:diacylglycerol kinase|uniref:Undecaprenol kinase n=1 Tax=Pseudobacter ginsenosidimutans TaxID=661488 RepID=A0A4Q7MG49_9BACT|nr:diacylglycerol kinase family protein [Pseudobacter ginsenosidimutans]QEC45542.1 diacylglycerol kinase family protein [Pseudobacter ginsenosidimutans]RZS67081.1 undecaprenol kinase [Pseudobacter ginsenosidimutans]